MKKTNLEFIAKLLPGYKVELEYQFDFHRKWRFDLAIPARMIALEVDGGLFVHGGHNRGKQIILTHEKENEAVLQGWRILKCTPRDVQTCACLTLLERALKNG